MRYHTNVKNTVSWVQKLTVLYKLNYVYNERINTAESLSVTVLQLAI